MGVASNPGVEEGERAPPPCLGFEASVGSVLSTVLLGCLSIASIYILSMNFISRVPIRMLIHMLYTVYMICVCDGILYSSSQ